ncbi:MAG: M23 family metallopeptidase [Thermotogae bacterium]|nr:M23 family metallopeptidase [Thermotogota bacterium]
MTRILTIMLGLLLFVGITAAEILYFPSPQTVVSSGFGEFRPSSSGLMPHFHLGVDFPTYAREGVEIKSIGDGYVYKIEIDEDSIYGYTVYVKNKNFISLYAHLSAFGERFQAIAESLKREFPDQRVEVTFPEGEIFIRAGEIIGYSGRTGDVLAPHCHLELRDLENKTALNPIPILNVEKPDGLKVVIDEVRIDGESYPATSDIIPFKSDIPKIEVSAYLTYGTTVINPYEVALKIDGKEIYRISFDTIRLSEFTSAYEVYGKGSTYRKYWFKMYSSEPLSVIKTNAWRDIPKLPDRVQVDVIVKSFWDDVKKVQFELVRR